MKRDNHGHAVNLNRGRRLLRLMGLETVYAKPRLSAATTKTDSSNSMSGGLPHPRTGNGLFLRWIAAVEKCSSVCLHLKLRPYTVRAIRLFTVLLLHPRAMNAEPLCIAIGRLSIVFTTTSIVFVTPSVLTLSLSICVAI